MERGPILPFLESWLGLCTVYHAAHSRHQRPQSPQSTIVCLGKEILKWSTSLYCTVSYQSVWRRDWLGVSGIWSNCQTIYVHLTCLEYIKYINRFKTTTVWDWEELGTNIQVGDPKKDVGTFMHASRFQTKLAPTWNWRFVLHCCDVPITVRADQESGRCERRPSLIRRLSVLPKPTIVRISGGQIDWNSISLIAILYNCMLLIAAFFFPSG